MSSESSTNHGLCTLPVDTDPYLSVTVIEFLVLACLVVVAVHAPLSMIARITGITFRAYVVVSSLLSLVGVGIVALHLHSRLRGGAKRDSGSLVLVLLLGLLGAVLALATLRPDTDDYLYVPDAVHFLDRLDEPMDLYIHFFVESLEDPIVSVSQGTSTAYEYCRAAIAFLFNTDFLDIYYIASVGLMGFLIPLAHFLLARRLTSDSRHALMGAVVSVSVLLIMTEVHHSFGNFAFPRIFQGKAVLLSVVLPVFAAFTISYFARPTGARWWCLFATATAGVGMSPSAAVLLPIHASVLAAAYMASVYRRWGAAFSAMLQTALKYLCTVAFSVAYVGVLHYLIRIRGLGNDPFTLRGVAGGADASLSLIFSTGFPLTPTIIVLASVLVVALVRDWRRTFMTWWAVMVAVLFLSPLAENLWTKALIPANMYWRLYYLYPFPAVVILAGAVVFDRVGKRLSRQASSVAVALLLVLSTGHYLGHFHGLGQIGWSDYKLPVGALQDARAVVSVAPEGVMLAPEDLYGIIPMLGAGHPQIRTRPDGQQLWIPQPRERGIRVGASQFVGGNRGVADRRRGELNDLRRLLAAHSPDVLVLDTTVWRMEEAASVISNAGYMNHRDVGGYTVVWK
jgi:hypothetical protein